MAEFSTSALLELQVDERSLRDARSTIENRVGSVRTDVATDGGRTQTSLGVERRSRENAMARQLLTQQLEVQQDILDELKELGPEVARSGGGGLAGGLLGGGLIGGALASGGLSGSLSGAGSLLGRLGSMFGGGTGAGAGLGAGAAAGVSFPALAPEWLPEGSPLNTNPATGEDVAPSILTGEGREARLDPFIDAAESLDDVQLENPLDDWQWPDSPLSNWQWPTITEPSWLDSLSSFSVDSPGWLDGILDIGNQQQQPSVLPDNVTEGGDVRLRNAARQQRGEESIAAEVNVDQTFNMPFSAELNNLQREFDSQVQEIQDAVGGLEDEIMRRLEDQILR